MKFIHVILIAIAFSACHSNKESQVEKPNILFILADDLGYSDLSCMGSAYYETPNIDAIAQSGMIFTDGYAGCQVCSPSRASIMTGQFTARHGITDWIGAPEGEDWRKKKRFTKVLPASYKHHLDTNAITFPMAFKEAGYTTFFAGKWHLGDVGYYPEDFGFDINIGGYHSGSPRGGYFAPYKNPKLQNKAPGENLTMRLARETIKFIAEPKDKPFLAYLSFYAVHGPIQTSKEKWMKYRDKAENMGIAEKGFTEGDLLPMRAFQDNPVYAGLVETIDDAVGMVLNALKENELDNNTIVIFTSDNGGVTSGDNYSTNCSPLKGGKGYQWEGGIRVPFMIHIPWMKHNGQSNHTPVAGSDVYPTMLELAGLPLRPEQHVDGKSMFPLLNGDTIPERPLYWHYPHYGNQGGRPVSIIRKGNWKLIHYWEDGHDELYNLVRDMHEDNNLVKAHPGIAKEMSEQLFSWLNEMGAKYPKPDPLYDEASEKKAIALKKERVFKSKEALRKAMLDKNWQPNDNWWGSIPTLD